MTMVVASGPQISRSRSPNALRREVRHAFGREAEMVRTMLARGLRIDSNLEHTHLVREWTLGTHIADLAIFTIPDFPLLPQALRKLGSISHLEMAVLGEVVQGCGTPEEIAMSLFLRPLDLHAALGRLTRHGLVQNEASGRLSVEWSAWVPRGIHLIEAKLEDWQEAVAQAVYYRTFADFASVALPVTFSSHLEAFKTCVNSGVGLILVDAHGGTEVALAAPKVPPRESIRRMTCSLRLLRRVLLDATHAPVSSLSDH